ncbi:MAG: hypothetical protein CMM44_09280 [Rhodospirillaceae bacterium]|nr:hypothetical protein [Rhodospirillaceae bacterium]|tara:strand:+ start:3824 stop:4321 length:498 start_codon:yes stop_codon:yes gene_type:complete
MKVWDNREGIKDKGNLLNLVDLSYEERIAIWSLRMYLSGEQQKMRAEFNRSMPPAIARIATGSVSSILDSIRYYGKNSLLFYCLCKECLSEDEKRIVFLFQAIKDSDLSRTNQIADTLVKDEGIEKIIDAVTGFLVALRMKDVRQFWVGPWRTEHEDKMQSTSIH